MKMTIKSITAPVSLSVIPANAGNSGRFTGSSRLRGNDNSKPVSKKTMRLIVFFLLAAGQSAFAAFEPRDISARAVAMADSYVASADDLGSIAWNPAGLSFLKGLTASFSGYEWYPSLIDDHIYSACGSIAYPLASAGVIAFSFDRFSLDRLYTEQQFVLSHSFQFFRKISFGYNLKLLSLAIGPFGTRTAFSVDAGCIAKYSDKLRFGFFFRNLIAPVLAGSSDNVSRGGEIGLSFTPVAGLLFSLSAAKYTGYDLFAKIGQELRLWNFLCLRTGFDTGSARFTAGLGLSWRYFRFDYAFVFQNSLSDQSVFSLSFDLSESRRTIWKEAARKTGSRLTLEDLGPEKEYIGEKVNINTATAEELQAIPRIGPATARSIVDFRDRNGPFLTKEDLMKVPRIGIKTFARLREFITVGTVVETNGQVIIKNEAVENATIDTVTLKALIDMGVPPMIAVKIVNYRESKGRIGSIDEIKSLEGMTEEEFNTLKPLIQPLFDRRTEKQKNETGKEKERTP